MLETFKKFKVLNKVKRNFLNEIKLLFIFKGLKHKNETI
jgi:hypothetical protein